MSILVNAYYDSGQAFSSKDVKVDKLPDNCPLCHRSTTPDQLSGLVSRDFLQLVFRCPDDRCNLLFIGYYRKGSVQDAVNRNIDYFFIGNG